MIAAGARVGLEAEHPRELSVAEAVLATAPTAALQEAYRTAILLRWASCPAADLWGYPWKLLNISS